MSCLLYVYLYEGEAENMGVGVHFTYEISIYASVCVNLPREYRWKTASTK